MDKGWKPVSLQAYSQENNTVSHLQEKAKTPARIPFVRVLALIPPPAERRGTDEWDRGWNEAWNSTNSGTSNGTVLGITSRLIFYTMRSIHIHIHVQPI